MAEFKVSWGHRSFRGDATTVHKEIRSLGDNFKPQEMVAYARENEDSELYKCFTWDDSVAAEKYRIEEARLILRCLVVKTVEKDKSEEAPQPIRVFQCNEIRTGYKPIEVIVKDVDEYQKLLAMAKSELAMFRRKYERLSELEAVFEAIDEL